MNKADEKIALALAQVDAEEFKNMDMTAADNWVPSEKFEKKIGKLLKHRKEPFIKIAGNARKRFAAVACAFLVFFGAAMSVEASREFIVGFVVDIYENISKFAFENPEGANAPKEIEIRYYPEYIPDEYELRETKESRFRNEIVFYNKKDQALIYTQYLIDSISISLDTEDVNINEIKIGDYSGYYYISKELINIIWKTDEYVFYISGDENITLDALIEMAESLKAEEK
ncbi:MAG: DUF4367 domain-containing protein [Ruminococcaceae bacterium]|nr:DUF4367 domain-containing protein [Oscillospiraceae bacterium]